MKYSAALVAAVATIVSAQNYSGLPSCAPVCLGGMERKAYNEFGCSEGDVPCYCSKVNFGNGVVDCSNEACGARSNAVQVISLASSYCSAALATAPAASQSNASGYAVLTRVLATMGGETATGSGAGATATGTGSGGAGGIGGGSGGSSTSVITTTVATGTTTVTGGAGGMGGNTGTNTETVTGATGTGAAGGMGGMTTVTTTTPTADNGSGNGNGNGGSATDASATSSKKSSGAGAMMTAAPLAGAGAMAALFFL